MDSGWYFLKVSNDLFRKQPLECFEHIAPHQNKLPGFSLFLLAVSEQTAFKASTHVQITAGSHSSSSSSSCLCVEIGATSLHHFAVGQSQKWYFAASESSGLEVKFVTLSVHVFNPDSVLFRRCPRNAKWCFSPTGFLVNWDFYFSQFTCYLSSSNQRTHYNMKFLCEIFWICVISVFMH